MILECQLLHSPLQDNLESQKTLPEIDMYKHYVLALFAFATSFQTASAPVGITSPLLPQAHADPCIIKLRNGSYFSFASQQRNKNTGKMTHVPVAMSPNDLKSGWTEPGEVDALPSIGVWANSAGPVGSPDLHQLVSPDSYYPLNR